MHIKNNKPLKIAVFFDLPDGGARYALYKIIEQLYRQEHLIDSYTFDKVSKLTDFNNYLKNRYEYKLNQLSSQKNKHLKRILNDLCAITNLKKIEKKIANDINFREYDLVIVNHTRYFQAPYVLRYLETKTIFICHEPTRAFFEKTLQPDKELPLLNLVYEKIVRIIKKRIEITNAKYAKITIANSKFSANKIKFAYGIKPKVVYLGVDKNDFFPMKIKKKNEVIVVGNDEPQKRLSLAIETIAQIPKLERPKLHIISPRKNGFEQLKKMSKKLQVELKVSCQVNTKELRKIYSAAKLSLAVAIQEPFGMSVIESMACGTPVIAVNEGGFKETILQGKTGWLVPARPKNLAQACQRIDELDFKHLSKRVTTLFSWEKTIQKLLSV